MTEMALSASFCLDPDLTAECQQVATTWPVAGHRTRENCHGGRGRPNHNCERERECVTANQSRLHSLWLSASASTQVTACSSSF